MTDQARINRRQQHFKQAALHERLKSPQAIQATKASRHGATQSDRFAIFEVQSAATGDGIYNCYKQVLDANEWSDTAGDPKFDDIADPESTEVLNLAEFDPESTYVAQLAAGDLLIAWQDDDSQENTRWMGVPFRKGAHGSGLRRAYCKDDADAKQTMDCFLDIDTTGEQITATAMVAQGDSTNLNSCWPVLEDGDPISVTKIGSTWYIVGDFQPIDICG
jgi:hypothetical protein